MANCLSRWPGRAGRPQETMPRGHRHSPLTSDAHDIAFPVFAKRVGFDFGGHAFVVEWAPGRGGQGVGV